jgi:DNA modification methylase
MVMQIAVKVETGFNCNWRNIEPLQPEGFKGQTANEKETLKNSIVKNGFNNAFDVWQHEGRLLSIDGVHRKIALLELAEEGYEIPEQLPCTYVTAANETEAATIILSRNSQHSHILSAAVMTAAFKIPAATIEAVVPQKNLEAWSENDNSVTEQLTAEEDDFDFEEGGIETDIVLGDLFEIGVHRLLCGDSTCSDSVERLMDSVKADMVFTSPPYNGNTVAGFEKDGGRAGLKSQPLYDNNETDNKTAKEYIQFNADVFNTIKTIASDDLVILYNINYNRNSPDLFIDVVNTGRNAFNLVETIIWEKSMAISLAGDNLTRIFEFIFVFYNGVDKPKLNKSHTNECIRNLWDISNNGANHEIHKACFPIKLAEKAINIYAKQNALLYEPFCGSGSTMVAAHQLNRKCYGMELEPKYCQVIIDRMKKLDPTLVIKKNGVIYE